MARHVTLRDVHVDDLPIFYANQRDPDAIRMADFPSRNLEDFMAHWRRCLADELSTLKTVVADGAVAGNIVCWQKDGVCNVGYWLGKEHWGQRIASTALAQFVELITDRPLYAHVAEINVASIRVLQKCGFVVHGESLFDSIDGEPTTELIMILYPSEVCDA